MLSYSFFEKIPVNGKGLRNLRLAHRLFGYGHKEFTKENHVTLGLEFCYLRPLHPLATVVIDLVELLLICPYFFASISWPKI